MFFFFFVTNIFFCFFLPFSACLNTTTTLFLFDTNMYRDFHIGQNNALHTDALSNDDDDDILQIPSKNCPCSLVPESAEWDHSLFCLILRLCHKMTSTCVKKTPFYYISLRVVTPQVLWKHLFRCRSRVEGLPGFAACKHTIFWNKWSEKGTHDKDHTALNYRGE